LLISGRRHYAAAVIDYHEIGALVIRSKIVNKLKSLQIDAAYPIFAAVSLLVLNPN